VYYSLNFYQEVDKSRDKLLIGFINVSTPGLALGIYDFDSEDFRWIDLSGLGENIYAISDIHHLESGYCLLAHVDNYDLIAFLDPNLNLSKCYRLNDTREPHSFIPFEDGFLVTDTKGNGINRIQIQDDILSENRYWSYDEEKENVDINSIALFNGEVYISICGPKPKQGTWWEAIIQGWDSARNGKIMNISNGKIICDNLIRPHSLVDIEGMLFWLESGTGLVHSFSQKHGCSSVIKLDGYLRGMAYDETYIYVASSAFRSVSGTTDDKAFTSNNRNIHCHIYRINRKDLKVETKRLTIFGNEIRGLTLIKSYGNLNELKTEGMDPILQRILAYEKELARNARVHAKLIQEKEAILNSTSWKFSAPIRWIGKLLSKIKN